MNKLIAEKITALNTYNPRNKISAQTAK